jgi:hypothetical protein
MLYLQLFSSLFDNGLKLKSFCDLVAELLRFTVENTVFNCIVMLKEIDI